MTWLVTIWLVSLIGTPIASYLFFKKRLSDLRRDLALVRQTLAAAQNSRALDIRTPSPPPHDAWNSLLQQQLAANPSPSTWTESITTKSTDRSPLVIISETQ